MNNRKYTIDDEVCELIDGHILHRIRAVRDFGAVREGDLGGLVESEGNLSHEGLCWVGDEAKVLDRAIVRDDAQVYHSATIYDDAQVYGHARVFHSASVGGASQVYNRARVGGYAFVTDYARIYDGAFVADHVMVGASASICDSAVVSGEAVVSGTVSGCAYIHGSTNVPSGETIHDREVAQ